MCFMSYFMCDEKVSSDIGGETAVNGVIRSVYTFDDHHEDEAETADAEPSAVDADGDMVLPRKRRRRTTQTITLTHSAKTPLSQASPYKAARREAFVPQSMHLPRSDCNCGVVLWCFATGF